MVSKLTLSLGCLVVVLTGALVATNSQQLSSIGSSPNRGIFEYAQPGEGARPYCDYVVYTVGLRNNDTRSHTADVTVLLYGDDGKVVAEQTHSTGSIGADPGVSGSDNLKLVDFTFIGRDFVVYLPYYLMDMKVIVKQTS